MLAVMTSTVLIGVAGVNPMLSELSRCGLAALPTVRNAAAYDILVAKRPRRVARQRAGQGEQRRMQSGQPLEDS
jgi:hypothetical protein